MNFKNRLEALKWMCENVGKEVHFHYDVGYVQLLRGTATMSLEGIIEGLNFYLPSATNFRTTPDYTPDPKPEPELEFEWPTSLRMCAPASNKQFWDYHDALIPFLGEYFDKRFVRK